MSQMTRFFEKQEIGVYSDGSGMLWGSISCEHTQWNWVVSLCGQTSEIVSLRALSPVKVPEDRRGAAAEYLIRANWNLNFGNFDMDWSDGEVNFRTSVPTTAGGISAKAMKDLFYSSCQMMKHYLPGLLAVVIANEDPAKAAKAAEVIPETDGPPAAADINTEETDRRLRRLFGEQN
jgi:hypothetical protein